MHSVHISRSKLLLTTNEPYLVVDPLYLDKMRNQLSLAVAGRWRDLQEQAFPFGENSFAIHIPKRDIVSIEMIENMEIEYQCSDFSCFECDTGSIVFVRIDCLVSVIERFSYDEVFSKTRETMDSMNAYLAEVFKGLPTNSIAMLLSQGVYGKTDFVGSGCYRIKE